MTLEEASKIKNTEIAQELVSLFVPSVDGILLTSLVPTACQAPLQHVGRRYVCPLKTRCQLGN